MLGGREAIGRRAGRRNTCTPPTATRHTGSHALAGAPREHHTLDRGSSYTTTPYH